MPFFVGESLIFRIFCEIPLKLRLAMLILSGLREDSVEMVKARGRALTRGRKLFNISFIHCRNGKSPRQGIDALPERINSLLTQKQRGTHHISR